MILTGILYAHDIPDAFHDAYRTAVAGAVGAYGAYVSVGYHHAVAAIPDIVAEVLDRRSEMMNILLRLLQQVESQSESASTAYSGKRTYGVNCFCKKL